MLLNVDALVILCLYFSTLLRKECIPNVTLIGTSYGSLTLTKNNNLLTIIFISSFVDEMNRT